MTRPPFQLRRGRTVLDQLLKKFQFLRNLGARQRRVKGKSKILYAPASDRNNPGFDCVVLIRGRRTHQSMLILQQHMLRRNASIGNRLYQFGLLIAHKFMIESVADLVYSALYPDCAAAKFGRWM